MSAETLESQELLPPPPSRSPRLPDAFSRRLRGDLGQIPVVLALLIIAVYFQIATSGNFLRARNLTEMIQEIITIATLALGSVLVLLVREIDLSLGSVSGLGAGAMAVLSFGHGWPWPAAILAALLVGALAGAINGFFISVVRVPAFIVTLAALIGYQGLLLHIMLPTTTLPIRDPQLLAIATAYLPAYAGIGLPVIGVAVYALTLIRERAKRQSADLPIISPTELAIRIGVIGIVAIGGAALFQSYRGVPLTAMLLIGLILVFFLVMRRTAFGLHVYAVGGNPEAARRAGVDIVRLRIIIFILASTLAALGGIFQASRQISATSAIDPTLVLNAIAAPVIGGVSLFGGRGSVWAVILGSLIVGSLLNGLALTGQGTDVEQMVEGGVLLVAVIADALVRRRSATGLR
ncbi:MAG: inner-membrane translocator [Chloroflexota bacterium]|nr:inner-membrane translocator [Chloroflexota bacterium]